MEAGNLDFSNRDSIEGSESDNGTVTLAWNNGGTEEVELQQSTDGEFESPLARYRGKDSGSVITGLAEGVHFFRVRAFPDGEWSNPLQVKVKFFPRFKLYLILGIGGIVVLATIGTIVVGHFTNKGKEGSE